MSYSVNRESGGAPNLELGLAEVLRSILKRPTWLKNWVVKRYASQHKNSGWDLIATGPLMNGRQGLLCIDCKLHLQPNQFPQLADRPCPKNSGHSVSRVLGMPSISLRMAALCEQHGWGWIDLAGNCRLEIPGVLLIERSGNGPVRVDRSPRANLSSPEAGRVLRALLAPENTRRRWTQREIIDHLATSISPLAAPSLGLVNKVIKHLRDQAFLEPLPTRGFRVRDYEGLLQTWGRAWRFNTSVRRPYFTLLHGRAFSESLRSLASRESGRIAYAAFSAAEVQAPYVRQSRTWLYLDPEAEPEFRAMIEAKPVESGDNIVVLIPNDSGVFYDLDNSSGMPCTNPVQTYVDLLHAGGRGEEAADAVLQQRLKPCWKDQK